MSESPLRVIQWATGSIGAHAIPAILEDPGFELAGAKVYSESKEGRDVGDLLGIEAYADDMALATEQDFPIWENKVYHDRPRLCDGDGPVGDYRRWASQFYVDEEGAL
jgi:hypothetical protein